jgi:hypothetical protein
MRTQLNLAATASRAQVLRFPSVAAVNPLAHLPATAAQLRAEIRLLKAEIEALRNAAQIRAQREARLAIVTVVEIDGLAAFRAKLGSRAAPHRPKIILTTQTARVID